MFCPRPRIGSHVAFFQLFTKLALQARRP